MGIELMEVMGDHHYISPDQSHVMSREYGLSPVGNPYLGSWVLRKYRTGEYIDHDYNRNDLIERNQIKVQEF
jgi:hypothetical protein